MGRDPPLDIAPPQKGAGRDEPIDAVEVCCNDLLPQKKLPRLSPLNAGRAAGKIGAPAQIAIGALDHVSVGGAHCEIVVQRHDDGGVREHGACQRQHFDADAEVVVNVHYVRRKLLQELFVRHEVEGDCAEVGREGRVPEGVVAGVFGV